MYKSQKLRVTSLLLVFILATTLSLLFSQQGFQVGFSFFTATDDQPVPVGAGLFSFRNPQGVLVSEAAVSATPPISRGRVYIGGDAPTGVAFANPWKESVAADLTVRDAVGTPMAAAHINLAPRNHSPQFVSELFPQLEEGFTGTLIFETTDPDLGLGTVTLRQSMNSHGEPLFATLPVVDLSEGAAPAGAADGVIVFAQVGAGPGLSTAIILINPTDSEISGAIQLTASDGSPLSLTSNGVTASQFAYQLSANGTGELEFTSSSDETLSGYASVLPNKGSALPSGTAIFRFREGDNPVSEAGVAAIPPSDRVRMFVDNRDTLTGVALAIPGAAATDFEFTLLSLEGVVLDSANRNVPANGHTAVFVNEIFSALEAGFQGLMEISTSANGLQGPPVQFVPVSLKLTINQREDNILTTLPVADMNRVPQHGTYIFSQVGFGFEPGLGELNTRLIFISADTGRTGMGRLFFFRSDGSDLSFPLEDFDDSRFTYEIKSGGEIVFTPGILFDIAAILVDPANLVVNEGNTISLDPITLDEEGEIRDDFELQFASMDAATVSVDANGNMTGETRGFADIVISSGNVVETFQVVVPTLVEGGAGFGITGVAQDFGGKAYLANTRRNTVMLTENLIDVAQVWAGKNGIAGYVDGLRSDALLNGPTYLALDQAGGTLYLADSSNHVIRAVTQGENGAVSTLAGTTEPGNQDGEAASATFNHPAGVALDRNAGLWVVDTANHTVRRIDLPTGIVNTIAGLPGVAGLADGSGDEARFNAPTGLAVEKELLRSELQRRHSGEPAPPVSVIVADTGNGLLRRIWEDGLVETIDPTNVGLQGTGISTSGDVLEDLPVEFDEPAGVVVDAFGNIYVSEPSIGRVRLLLSNGEVVQAAQTGTFNTPLGLATTIPGCILVAERLNSVQEIRYAGPELTSVSPSTGGNPGGELISIEGGNFAPDSALSIDGTPVLDFEILSTTRIDFILPPLPSGVRTLSVQHRGGLVQSPLLVEPVALSELNDGEVTTLAGGTAFGGDGQFATEAATAFPGDVIVDLLGNVFVADREHHRIRKMDSATRILTTIAGTGVRGFSGDNGPAVHASLSFPSAIALDGGSNLFIADSGNHVVRSLDLSSGIISRVAGVGEPGFSGDGGPALNASLAAPGGVAFGEGNLLIADTLNERIRSVDTATGIITTIYPVAPDPAPNTSLQGNGEIPFNPAGLALDAGFSLFIANPAGHTVEVLELVSGMLHRLAGTGTPGFSGDGGPPDEAGLNAPSDVTVDPTGAVCIADRGNHRVRCIDADFETIQTVAGTGTQAFSGDGADAVAADLNSPIGIAANGANDLLIADFGNHRLRRVAPPTGTITTLAGNGELPATGDDGQAWLAALNAPHEIVVSSLGQVFVADSGHHRLRIITLDEAKAPLLPTGDPASEGVISSIVGDGIRGFAEDLVTSLDSPTNYPFGIALDFDGNLLFSENGNHRIRRINDALATFTPSVLLLGDTTGGGPGSIETTAGTGGMGSSGDGGAALLATLNSPRGVAALLSDVYVADELNHRIRRVDGVTGVIETVAGNGVAGFSGNDGLALQASLNRPRSVAVAPSGDLFIADTGNHQIRMVFATTGIIVALAGNGVPGFDGDGGQATLASLNRPEGVALDAFGRVFVADTGNNRVRQVAPNGVITTIAGTGLPGVMGDGGDALDAAFREVSNVCVDQGIWLFITDRGNQRIRIVRNP